MKILFCWVSLFLSCAPCFAQLELPVFEAGDIVVVNNAGRYTFKYLPNHRVSKWVAYKLTRDDIKGDARRSSNFRSDSVIVSMGLPYATTAMYKNSGYDRGHLVASADRLSSQAANRATFSMANIAPQNAALNRGVWKSLEEQVRQWAVEFDTLYIVCGPIIEREDVKLSGFVTVPSKFYKAVLLRKGEIMESRCYIMPNDTVMEQSFELYEEPLESLEKASGIDLIWNNPRK